MRIPKTIAEKLTGSYSHGSLRPEDILEGIQDAALAIHAHVPSAETASLLWDAENADPEDSETLVSLMDRLTAVLPEGFYFGALEGDASDFGIWRESDPE